MTDKQIIIDGVDVSGCSYHYKHTRVCLVKMDAAGRYYNCANWHDCDFKKLSQQLKRKEQECERLNNIINEAKNSKLDLKSFLVGEAIQNEYQQQLDQLKAENEELKKYIKHLHNLCGNETDKQYKLHKTLTEIKEIAEFYNNSNMDDICYSDGIYDILQKISEVEDDR